MEEEKRKSMRLPGYNYSQNGVYCVTICTHNRELLFGDIKIKDKSPIVGAIHESPLRFDAPICQLTAHGRILDNLICQLPERFPGVTVEKYVIMPNHIHMLIGLQNQGERAIHESPLPKKRSALSKIVGYLKMNVSKQIHLTHPTLAIWQRGYFERIIRNDQMYQHQWTYIDHNPLQWELDEYYR